MKKFKPSILASMIALSSFAYADIITDTVSNGHSNSSIQKTEEQIDAEKIKNIDLFNPNFNPAEYFTHKASNKFNLNLKVFGRKVTIKPHATHLSPQDIKDLESATEQYAQVISNCKNGQAVFREVLNQFEDKYNKNQNLLNRILESVAEGKYSDSNLLSIELLLRSEIEAYRCVYMNAAINIVEKQKYIDQVNENINNLQKRNYALRNTFDSIRYLYLDLSEDKILKDRIY